MSECSIPEFYECVERKSRKEYQCCECNAPIVAGEKYFAIAGKWEGDFNSYRQHVECCQACRMIRDNLNGGECICFGGLMEWYAETRRYCDKVHPLWGQFRRLIAGIKLRERSCKLRLTATV